VSKTEVRIAGIGGQGVVLSGVILGRAASLYDGKRAIQTQAYGSDIRGGDVCCELIISDEEIVYPAVKNPDILIVLAQKVLNSNIGDLKKRGALIVDSDLVDTEETKKAATHCGAPFNRIAIDELGNRIVSNMIMLGFVVERTGIVSFDALKQAVADLVPPKTLEMNLRALERGVSLA
jgi:2-oxoglutarate ferredoxin oxidoreductase subunit gamma